jgi:hypothetical protein
LQLVTGREKVCIKKKEGKRKEKGINVHGISSVYTRPLTLSLQEIDSTAESD